MSRLLSRKLQKPFSLSQLIANDCFHFLLPLTPSLLSYDKSKSRVTIFGILKRRPVISLIFSIGKLKILKNLLSNIMKFFFLEKLGGHDQLPKASHAHIIIPMKNVFHRVPITAYNRIVPRFWKKALLGMKYPASNTIGGSRR